MFNFNKYRIFVAIDFLNAYDIPAHTLNISRLAGLDVQVVRSTVSRLSKYKKSPITMKYHRNRIDGMSLTYTMTSGGVRILKKYHDRYERGLELSLRKTNPKKIDYGENFKLLPGLDLFEEELKTI